MHTSACSTWCGITRGTILAEPAAGNEGEGIAPLYVGVGRAKMSRMDMFRQTSGIAIAIEQPVVPTSVQVQGKKPHGVVECIVAGSASLVKLAAVFKET